MKLRIGNSIPPKDIFQLIFTSDDISEVLAAPSAAVCKVDFINTILANELLFLVEEWHKGLKQAPEPDLIQKFFKKYGKAATAALRYFFPLLSLFVACNYSDYLYPLLGMDQNLSLATLKASLLFLLTTYMLGNFIGRQIENSIDRKLDKLEEYPNFMITKGDYNSSVEFEQKNQKLTNQICIRIFWIVFGTLISYPVKFLIDHTFFKIKLYVVIKVCKRWKIMIPINEAQQQLQQSIDAVSQSHQPIAIAGQTSNAVLSRIWF